ncbi:MAG: AmmeMemoRadiSam system radical SAM enzyme [Syntrophales bacterium]|jgi:pyruvate formate lyase activating enzyme|nr:AmmeMemoRadiSam system radical SAM enzyme [Syntrophales bacterium]
MVHEALLYEKEEQNYIRCGLCAHRCRIAPHDRGICGVRENREGILYSLVYGKTIAENVDPVEKKPLFHFLPGSRTFSIATAGCNFRCSFCQNSEISQMPREKAEIVGRSRTPAQIVAMAIQTESNSISYTYTEPTVFFEFALDTAKIAAASGLKNIFVTNGFMTSEMLKLLSPCLHAANVDLKSFRDDFYRKYCGGRLQPVLDSLRTLKELGVWLEVTTLLIPNLNDGDQELQDIAAFVASLGRETPWHVSRFHPQYLMADTPATPSAEIHRAVETGKSAGLKYVYSGNLPGDSGENTLCSGCGNLLIARYGFSIERNDLQGTACPACGALLDGIF